MRFSHMMLSKTTKFMVKVAFVILIALAGTTNTQRVFSLSNAANAEYRMDKPGKLVYHVATFPENGCYGEHNSHKKGVFQKVPTFKIVDDQCVNLIKPSASFAFKRTEIKVNDELIGLMRDPPPLTGSNWFLKDERPFTDPRGQYRDLTCRITAWEGRQCSGRFFIPAAAPLAENFCIRGTRFPVQSLSLLCGTYEDRSSQAWFPRQFRKHHKKKETEHYASLAWQRSKWAEAEESDWSELQLEEVNTTNVREGLESMRYLLGRLPDP